MLHTFFQSIVIGILLAAMVGAGRALLRRVAFQQRKGLPPGQELRCVRPLDLADR